MRSKLMVNIGLALAIAAGSPSLCRADEEAGFNEPGNILISDQFNNRVVEVTRHKKIVWSFGSNNPSLCNPGPGTIIAPNDVERLADGLTLMAGTGTTACPDNRVIVVDQSGFIVFQFGVAGVAGSDNGHLNTPVFALETPNHTFLITDQVNARIIEVDQGGNVIYTYQPTGSAALNNPNAAELLPNGDILIADENNSRVTQIRPSQANRVVWQYSTGLNIVAFASRLPGGHTLITDSGNNRIVEINNQKQVVFQYFTNRSKASNPTPNPTNAVRLVDGTTLIADQFNNRVLIIDSSKKILFQYGQTNLSGNGPNQLFAPYNAMSIGDYTGVTPPPKTYAP